MGNKFLTAILMATLFVGSLDILLAFAHAYVKSGITPERVLRFIASGIVGKEAFGNTKGMVALGLALHYLVAGFFTALLFIVYPEIKWIATHKLLSGILFGIFTWCVMNLLVLPGSNAPRLEMEINGIITGMMILIAAVGLPLVFIASRYYSQRNY